MGICLGLKGTRGLFLGRPASLDVFAFPATASAGLSVAVAGANSQAEVLCCEFW